MPSVTNTRSMADKITSIIAAYRHRSSALADRFAEQKESLQKQVEELVKEGRPLNFILPSFPFKAPVQLDGTRSTLGSLPDKAEEIALQTLDGFADSIVEVYRPGATVTVVSDASVYGDILKVDDQDAFQYGKALRQLAEQLKLKHLNFIRPIQIVAKDEEIATSLQQYNEQNRRVRVLLDTDLNGAHTTSKENTEATKKYYDKVVKGSDESLEGVRESMIRRGKAYASLVATHFPDSIRLSIHDSNNLDKTTIDLFPPSLNPDFITPWHGAVAVHADASVTIVDASTVDMQQYQIITNAEGQPWLLREKSALFEWTGMELEFEPLYPCGMLVRPIGGRTYRFEDVDMQQVRKLALATAPLLLRGFTMEVEKEVFRSKASQLGQIQVWPFGDILEVRENASFNMNNVLTNEAMPFHYDGVFRTEKDEKTGKVISVPPLFQMFRNRAASQQVGGLTLFSTSRNMLELLSPDTITLQNLKNLQWRTFTVANEAFGGDELILPFISSHPETGKDVFRFHEPWPAEKCISPTSEPTLVEVVQLGKSEGEELCDKLVALMYDRRVTYRHQWQEGDLIFNDNMTTHHTRTAFESGHRELWRVHVN